MLRVNKEKLQNILNYKQMILILWI